jgi:hypothetical protein
VNASLVGSYGSASFERATLPLVDLLRPVAIRASTTPILVSRGPSPRSASRSSTGDRLSEPGERSSELRYRRAERGDGAGEPEGHFVERGDARLGSRQSIQMPPTAESGAPGTPQGAIALFSARLAVLASTRRRRDASHLSFGGSDRHADAGRALEPRNDSGAGRLGKSVVSDRQRVPFPRCTPACS